MTRPPILKSIAGAALAVALLAAGSGARPARAEGLQPPHRLGDHPALVVQRLARQAGYDYASKFYPHPAWLRLYAAPPEEQAAADPPVEPAADQPADQPADALAGTPTETRVSKR